MTATPQASDRTETQPEDSPVWPSGLRWGPVWIGLSWRPMLATAVTIGLTVVMVFVTLGTGALPASPADVLAAVRGTASGGIDFAVMDIGLPRALTAIFVGSALGIAGALVQALTHNPLGSPDVLGFDSGTATGALVGMLVFGMSTSESAVMAVIGGALAAGVVFVFASGGREVSYRILLIGIGIGAMLDAINAYLLTRSRATESMSAARWLIGSLNHSTWQTGWGSAVGVAVLLPLALVVARHLRMVVLGGDLAAALGAPVRVITAATLLLAVGLSAVAVLAAGPISFVALAAPQIAGRICGEGGQPRVLSSAAVGAALLVVSDFLAQRAFSADLPVGVVTGAVGGVYLAWLLARQWRAEAA